MKKHIMKKALAVILSCAMVGVMGGCSLPFGQKDKEEEEEAAGIEASVSKVKIEVGDEEEIEIENYEDLKKLDFEVEDEDIATVEEDDDGVYVVTGISEGKTTVTFTAKDCEDLTIKITVEGGMEPQPVADAVFDLSSYDMTVDYDDYDVYLYINNWADIKDMAGDTISVTSSDPDVLYVSSWPSDDGGIWLSAYDEGYVTVTIEADGFETAYCSVECTHNSGSGTGTVSTGEGVDINSDGTINLWNVANDFVVCTLTNPIDYTLDDVYSTHGAVYFDSDSISGSYITIWSDCPMEMWNYLQGNDPEDGDGTLHADYELTDVTKIGTFNGEDVYVGWRSDPDNVYGEYDMVEMWFEYSAGTYDDYVTIELYPELVEGYDEDDFWTLFCMIFDN